MQLFNPHETARLKELDGVKLASFQRRSTAFLIDYCRNRNLSIEMRQIFYLFKQHFLMVNHRFGVYLSTPEHQAF